MTIIQSYTAINCNEEAKFARWRRTWRNPIWPQPITAQFMGNLFSWLVSTIHRYLNLFHSRGQYLCCSNVLFLASGKSIHLFRFRNTRSLFTSFITWIGSDFAWKEKPIPNYILSSQYDSLQNKIRKIFEDKVPFIYFFLYNCLTLNNSKINI